MRPRRGFALSLCIAAAFHAVVLLVPRHAGREAAAVPAMEISVAAAVDAEPAGKTEPTAVLSVPLPAPAPTAPGTPEPTGEPSATDVAPVEAAAATSVAPAVAAAAEPGAALPEPSQAGPAAAVGDRVPTGGEAGVAAESGGAASIAAAPALEPPRLITDVRPLYPRAARRAGWEGVVRINALVDQAGVVVDAVVTASSGHGSLDQAALEAVRRAIFAPGQLHGEAVSSRVIVPVRFRLD